MKTARRTDASKTPKELIKRLERYTVVDVDIHDVRFDKNVYSAYLEEPWKRQFEQIRSTEEPLTKSIRGRPPFDIDPEPHELGEEIAPNTATGIRNFMERFNTDYAILHGQEIGAVDSIPDRDFAMALNRAHNRYMLDQYLDEYDGFKGLIRVSGHAPEQAREEIHELADEDDMVAVLLSCARGELLGHQRYEPIFEAAAAENLPMDYHVGYRNPSWSGLWGGEWLHSTVEYLVANNDQNISHIPSLIFQGIPERYPDLDHIFIEQGITWIPWMEGRMDRNYELRKHTLPYELERKPSEYLRDNFYFGTQPIDDPAGMGITRKFIEELGFEDQLMYSSDYPHPDFDYPSILTIPNFSREVEEKIFGGNALEVYAF